MDKRDENDGKQARDQKANREIHGGLDHYDTPTRLYLIRIMPRAGGR
jgi:hypothetical protein